MNTRESENIAPVWQRLHQLLAVLPTDRWTSYGDIAAAIGSAAQPVGNYLAGTTRPNAHRVLRRNGEISQSFRWTDPGDTRDPREIMQAEGIHFTDRFSPGYGDLPLDVQKNIFPLLDCERKIGLTLNESLIMSPSKSVTAFVGMARQADHQ